MAKTKRLFVFDRDEDADLLERMDSLDGEKSAVVRAALRQYFQLLETRPAEPTIVDVVERLDRLQTDLAWLRQNGVPVNADSPGDDDPALTETLLQLGL